MKKLLTTGCSFTHAPTSWANYLSKDYDVANVAEGGAGNEMNIRNAMINIHKHNYTHCIIQISGINRFELSIDERVTSENTFLIPNENYTWIKSTGDQEWWHSWAKENVTTQQTKLVSNALNNYIQHCYSEHQQILNTLISIVNCQTLCKQKQIKQLYFFWKNELLQYIDTIKKSKELTAWWNEIDWKTFWLYNQYDGLCEWGIDQGYTGDLNEDHTNKPAQGWLMINGKKTMIGHPSTECHQAFANQIVKKWITQDD